MGCNYPGFRWIIISPLKNDQIEGNHSQFLDKPPRFAWFCLSQDFLASWCDFGTTWQGSHCSTAFHDYYCIPIEWLTRQFYSELSYCLPSKKWRNYVDSLTFWGDGERESTVDSLEQPLSPVVPAPAARCVRMTSGNPIHTRSMVDSNGINAVSNAMSQDLSKVGWSTNSTGDCSYLKTRPSDWCLFEGHLFFWKTPCNTTCHMWHDMRIYEI